MKSNIATLVILSTSLCLAHASDEPVNDAETAMNRVPVSAASLYREGESGMGKAWQGLRKLDESAVFLHRDVRKADKDMVYVWTGKEFVYPHYHEKEKPYLSIRERIVIDCAGMRAGVTESAFYEKRFGTGEAIARVQQRPDMIDILPDSIEEQMHHIACARPAPKPVKPLVKTASRPPVGQTSGIVSTAAATPASATGEKPEVKTEVKAQPKPEPKPPRSALPTADKAPGKTQT
jgi:hypothetical protein